MPSNTGQYGDNDYSVPFEEFVVYLGRQTCGTDFNNCYANTKKMAANFEYGESV